ncbi:AAA family ATPase [Streptomyces sp. NPDC050315]|uniref:ATP-binding protein n=1 Tax=Streptomyces sp. NPDC050315 TaxID=3155039 RepID=UPI00343E1C16
MSGLAEETVFLGREDELSSMHMRLRRAMSSEPQLVVVEGPAGIGKTRLVRRFLADVPPDGCVLQASGEENETHLPYAIVVQLLAHVAEGLDPPLHALDHCIRPGAAVPDPITVGSALLDAVGKFQDRAPVVVVIDDAHWADTPSLHSLTFVLRRLRVDRVMTVLVARDTSDPRLPPGLRRMLGDDCTLKLHLAGLGIKELRQLNTSLGGSPLPRWAVTRIREHTQGNPLHTKALLQQFPSPVFVGGGAVLPAPHAYERFVKARLDGCSPHTRRLVEAASVLGIASPLHLAARIAAVPDPLEALAEAMASDLLQEEAAADVPKVVFTHPLSRAAVYQGLPPPLRTQLHKLAARLSGEPAVALHHRAHAAVGPEAQLADELSHFAAQQAEEGAWSAAASAMMAAARLTADRSHHTQRFLQGVDYLLLAGDVSQAAELEQSVRESPPSTEQHYVLGHLALTCGRLDEARHELTICWDSCDARTPIETIRCTTEQLAWLYLIQGDWRNSISWSRRGLELPPGRRSSFLRDSLAIGLAFGGCYDEALKSLAHLPVSGPRTCPAELDGLLARGMIHLWNGDLSAACRDLKDAFVTHRRGGLAYSALVALGFLTDAEYRAGHWNDAVSHGTQAVSLAEDTDQVSFLAVVHSFVACPLAGRGDFKAAEAHVKTAVEHARVLSDINDTAIAATATARVRIAQGDYAGVVTALSPLLAPGIIHRAAFDEEAGLVAWRPLLAEALVRDEQLDDAETVLIPYEDRAADRDRWLDQAAAARCRGILEAARSRADAAERAFQAGLRHCERGEPCWEQALLHLAYGTFLRRTGKRGAAIPQLEAAWETFHRLQATPYLDRCGTELTACGRAVAGTTEAHHPLLTAMELTVARLAARGLTNRQIARELVLSAKTIEYHLSNAYPKLGINSRIGLASRLPPET